MATIKSYTDLEQSRKLAEILPLESADGYWDFQIDGYNLIADKLGYYKNDSEIPCWSLAALLDIVKTYSIRLEIALRVDKNYNIFAVSGDFVFRSFDECSEGYDNLVDACVAMIEKLHELKIL